MLRRWRDLTAAELSFLLTTCLGVPISPGRIEREMDGLSGLVWSGKWGGETLYVMERRGLRFFETARSMALPEAVREQADAQADIRNDLQSTDADAAGADEAGVDEIGGDEIGGDEIGAGVAVDPSMITAPALHARYRVVN